jgi:hypothetical protein
MIVYKINTKPGLYDKHFMMINSLSEFLSTHPDFSDEVYTIYKPVHNDYRTKKHFNFYYKGVSYHAYVEDVITVINGTPRIIKQRITHISTLTTYY